MQEELKKKALEYAGTVHRYRDAQGETEQMDDVAEAWIKGYEYLAKEIEKDGVVPQLYMDETIRQNLALKREIEKLKCCGNCKYSDTDLYDRFICELDEGKSAYVKTCHNYDKWESK